MEKTCLSCGETFDIKDYRLKHRPAKYCSRGCYYDSSRPSNKIEKICEVCGDTFYIWPRTERLNRGKYCSRKCYGQIVGITHSGENSPWWKGGITPASTQVRHSVDYKEWRESVFTRDNYTCQACEKRGGALNAHHFFPFAQFPEYRLDVWNGITLCLPCHNNTKGT